MAAGMKPDRWQLSLLSSPSSRILVTCSRQSGKSTTVAALALGTAIRYPKSLTLIFSPTQRQSSELFRKVKEFYRCLEHPVDWKENPFSKPYHVEEEQTKLGPMEQIEQWSVLQLELTNQSRIVSLPGNVDTIVGYSAPKLVVIDEAARVKDELYQGIRPMLATCDGKLVCLSTPKGKRGWFWEECEEKQGDWHRIRVKADQCPRIPKEFLREERLALGERWYKQEYEISFEAATDSMFAEEDIKAMINTELQPLFL